MRCRCSEMQMRHLVACAVVRDWYGDEGADVCTNVLVYVCGGEA